MRKKETGKQNDRGANEKKEQMKKKKRNRHSNGGMDKWLVV
jgi:hypothetical protein